MESNERNGEDKIQRPPVDPVRDNRLLVYPAALPARMIAFFLDYIMIFAIFYLISTAIIYPYFHPGFTEELRTFWEQQQNLPPDTGFREMARMQLDFQMEHEKAIADTQFIFIIIVWIYFALSEVMMQGSTLGKKVFKLQTIDLKTLKKPNGKTILIRNCFKTISVTIVFPLLLINFIIPFFNRSRLAGHDLLSKTMVTYENASLSEKNEVI
jgi:uncharacterized RDD family membrane protein YckC